MKIMGNAIKNYQKKQRRDQRDAYIETKQLVSEHLMNRFFGGNNNDECERSETR